MAVAVQVGYGNRAWTVSGAVIYSRGKGAVTSAQEDGYVVRVIIGNGKVLVAVAIQIGCGNRVWTIPGTVVDPRGKRAVTIAQQHGYIIGIIIGNSQVGKSVAIQIGCGNRVWIVSCTIFSRHGKGSVSVTLQDRHQDGGHIVHIICIFCYGKIGMAVAIKVCYGNRILAITHIVIYSSSKGAAAVAQQHGHIGRIVIGNCEVREIVAVQIAYGNRV